jgi:hypothetical protein
VLLSSRIRYRVFAVLTLMALAGIGASTASAQCGETIDLAARHSAVPGPAPLALGDSVLYDAAQPLAGDGFQVNAMVCRTMAQGIAVLEARAAPLPVLVVVALGTNGTVSNAQIESLLRILGPSRGLALVTPKGGDDPSVPGLFRAAARRHPGRILVLDWERVSAGHPDWFAPDGIHLGGAAGIDAFARLVASSLSALPGSGSTPPTTTAPATTPAPAPTPATATTTATAPPTGTKSVKPPPAVVKPKPAHSASMTPAERDQLRRLLLNVRLLVSAAVSTELSLLGT